MESTFAELLRRHLPYLEPGGELSADSSLKDLGLSSMQAVELLFDIEESYDVSLPDDRLTAETFATAGSLYEAVRDEKRKVAS